jgi:hypothetical protein
MRSTLVAGVAWGVSLVTSLASAADAANITLAAPMLFAPGIISGVAYDGASARTVKRFVSRGTTGIG